MKQLKIILALLLVMATLFSMVACNPGTGTGTGSDSSSAEGSNTTPPADSDETIVLFENEEWTRKVIRAEYWSNSEVSGLSKIRDLMEETTDIRPTLGNDFKRDDDVYDSEAEEIYFGYTAHPEMRELYKDLSFGDAQIKVVGNKILMAAYTYEAFMAIYNHLEELFTANYKDGKIEVKVSDLEMRTTVNEYYNTIPVPDNAVFDGIEDCALDQTLFLFEDATPETFESYLKKMEGHTLVYQNEDSGNYFATYKFGEDQLNVSYAKWDKKLRLIINEDTTPTDLFEKKEVKAVTTPLIIMHGLGWSDSQNGLCLLFRLSDGRFLIVDGGFNRQRDADDLYNLLVKYTPAGMTPTVAGWFITHAHGDHHATFASKFVNSYGNRVTIEKVIFNPPSPAINQSNNEGGGYVNVISVANSIKNCELIRCHVGDKYYFGDAEVDMLYTVDYQYPTTFTYYNTSSIIFSVKLGGQRIMVTGDGANVSFDKVAKMYGENLKADIVQVAHHGYGTGVSASSSTAIMQAYTYMSPSLVLWPIGTTGYQNVVNSVFNQHLVNLPSVQEIMVAEAKDFIIELPYSYKGNS